MEYNCPLDIIAWHNSMCRESLGKVVSCSVPYISLYPVHILSYYILSERNVKHPEKCGVYL